MPNEGAAAYYDFQNDASLSEKWRFRFSFFQKYGVPGFAGPSTDFKNAVKSLSFADKLKVNVNFFALFFTFIYFFIIGLWRQGVMVLGAAFALGIIGGILGLPDGALNGMGVGFALVCGLRANALYYRKKVQGIEDWSF